MNEFEHRLDNLSDEEKAITKLNVERFGGRLNEIPATPGVPIFELYQTEKLLNPNRSPEDILLEMKRLGMSRNFIDWVTDQGYKFRILRDRIHKPGFGSVDAKNKEIIVADGKDVELVNLTKVHELIHIATPRTSTRETIASLFYFEYEHAIDAIANHFLEDPNFLVYVDAHIPQIEWWRAI